MKYPYIGKVEAEGGSSILIKSSKSIGYIIKNNLDDALEGLWESGYCGDSHIKNITTEYLANTYGEVKSKEHAEFIVKLANNHGAICPTDINYNKCKFFYFSSTGALFFTKEKVVKLATDYKQITIPLPAECESVDEWPKVGDEVYLKCGSGIIKLPKDNEGFYIVEVNGDYTACKAYEMKKDKPKTEDEILAEELIAKYRHLSKTQQVHAIATDIINNAISRYNVTKKPR